MKINTKLQKEKNIFYNNIVLIVISFVIIFLVTSIFLNDMGYLVRSDILRDGMTYGPIKVTDRPQIYRLIAYFSGQSATFDVSAEVLDEDKDTLYEIGKELWYEEGYEDGEYYKESDRKLRANITFKEKGTYYIQVRSESMNLNDCEIYLRHATSSYLAHFEVGIILLILSLIVFYMKNSLWVKEKMEFIDDKLEDIFDD